MDNGVSLADIRKEATLKANCDTYGIEYIVPTTNETENERTTRHQHLRLLIRSKRRLGTQAQHSPEKRRRVQEDNAVAKRRQRANLSPEEQANERHSNTISRRQRRRQRANLSPEEQANERHSNTISRRQQRANLSPQQRESERLSNTESRRRQRETHQSNNSGDDIDDSSFEPPTTERVNSLVLDAMRQVTRTMRPDGTHQATVCVVCDRLITGEDKVCKISKERLENNRHRLSVETYEENFGQMHPLLVQQYAVEGLDKLLLSPRSYRDGDDFECCSSCFSSTKQSTAEKSVKPPKQAIANGFAIGHLPSTLHITGEDEPRVTDLDESKLSDLMCVAMSTQRSHGYVFAFTGGAHKSVAGNFTFFETDQQHMGSVVNQYRSTGANDHLLCVMCGRFTPEQRQIARRQAVLDTNLYINLMTWYIKESTHPAYEGLTPPEECPAPQIIEDAVTDNNTDQPQNIEVENQYQGGTFTFTSSNDPNDGTGTFRTRAGFASAIHSNVYFNILSMWLCNHLVCQSNSFLYLFVTGNQSQ